MHGNASNLAATDSKSGPMIAITDTNPILVLG
jgi:hypothetical protein